MLAVCVCVCVVLAACAAVWSVHYVLLVGHVVHSMLCRAFVMKQLYRWTQAAVAVYSSVVCSVTWTTSTNNCG